MKQQLDPLGDAFTAVADGAGRERASGMHRAISGMDISECSSVIASTIFQADRNGDQPQIA